MIGRVAEALRHLNAALAALRDAPTMVALGREVGDQWRSRRLDPSHHRSSVQPPYAAWPHRVLCSPPASPGRTTLDGLGVLSGPHPVAARRRAAVTASDGRGLRADDPRRGSVARPPPVPGRRVRVCEARYTGTARVWWPTQWATGVGAPWPLCGPSVMLGRASCWRRARPPGAPCVTVQRRRSAFVACWVSGRVSSRNASGVTARLAAYIACIRRCRMQR